MPVSVGLQAVRPASWLVTVDTGAASQSGTFHTRNRYGMGYAHYWVSEKGYYPGFGATVSIGSSYKVSKNLILGIETGAHYSSFKGGAAKNDPSYEAEKYPFELMSLNIGINATFYF